MSNVKLTQDQIKEIVTLWIDKNMTSKEIAKLYPVNFNHIQRVCKNYIPNDLYIRSYKSGSRKLSAFQVKKILIERLKLGTTYKELGNKYKVSAAAIRLICIGENWKHVFQHCNKKYNTEILSIR